MPAEAPARRRGLLLPFRNSLMILFVLGPSGVGKSSFGQHLAGLGWLHIEIDRYPDGDGIGRNDLRDEWDAYVLRNEPVPLVAELRRRTSSYWSHLPDSQMQRSRRAMRAL